MRRPVLSLIFFLCASLLSALPASADLKPAILGNKSDVKDIVSHFRAEMASLIAQAGGEARVTLMRAFQLSDQLVQGLTAAYGDSVKLTFDQIDAQQQKVFSDTLNAINELGQAIREPVDKGLKLGNTFAAITADVLSWTKKPMVTAYGPAYVAPASISDKIRIAVSGVRLHAAGVAAPKLKIKNVEFAPEEVTDVSIAFVVPRSVFSTPAKGTSFEKGVVTLFRPSESWLPGARPEEIQFSLVFTVLPEELGSYSVSTIESVPRQEEKLLTTDTLVAERNGGGGHAVPECYVPEKGYTFDMQRVRLVKTKHTAYKDNDTSPGTNSGGIYYHEGVKSEQRICIQVVASTGCKECGARTEGHLEAWMMRTLNDEKTVNESAKPLMWQEDVQLRLVKNAISQTITVRLFDEITRRVGATSQRSLQFLNVEPDPRNSSVFLVPQRDWTAK